MNNEYNKLYQYDSCIDRGICSINPRTSSLQEVLILYLRLTAYYALNLYNAGLNNIKAKDIIMSTISVMVSNIDISEAVFKSITKEFGDILPILVDEFKNTFAKEADIPKTIRKILKSDSKTDIIKSIQLGEKEFLKSNRELSFEERALYQIFFILVKSLCINVLDLATYGVNSEDGYVSILTILDTLNSENLTQESMKNLLEDVAKVDNQLMVELRKQKENRYGKSMSVEVSYSTSKGKAILVVGTNIRELEDVLDATKGEDIDVYTHGEMILANMYPKFKGYKNLKGQYGQGLENCLLDFSTFPGPIILTRHSLYNVEHLYRGLLYTTDCATSKGIIPIIEKNFEPLIEATKKSRGFKSGRVCETIHLGCDFEEVIKEIKLRINQYKRILIIGLGAENVEDKSYYNKLMAKTPIDTLIISLSYCYNKENILCINACFDSYMITKLTQAIINITNKNITLFFPQCDNHTITQIVSLMQFPNVKVFLGRCIPMVLNPNLLLTFQKTFGVKSITTVKKDLEEILK